MRTTVTLTAVLVVVFLALEQTARVYLFGIAGLDPRRVESLRDFWSTEFVRLSEHPELGFEHVPNARGLFKLVPYETNSHGLRDREYALEKPPGTFRTAVLGSSFTVPAGVEIEEAFHSVMEERLNLGEIGPTYEFINFAIGAFHPRQVASMLRLRALAWDPDLILFGVTSLSMPLLVGPQAIPAGGHHGGPRARTHPFFDSFLIQLVMQRLGLRDFGVQRAPLIPARNEPSILETLGAVSRKRQVPIVILRLEFDATRDASGEGEVVEAIRREGLFFLDTRERFRGVRARDFWVNPLDPHPNVQAHAVFAGSVTDFLRERSLLGESAR